MFVSKRGVLVSLLLAAGLANCRALGPVRETPTPIPPSATPSPPTETPVPLAARVNGQPIPLARYQEEVARYELALADLGIELASADEYKRTILEAMIDLELLVQGAGALGIQVSLEQAQAQLAGSVDDASATQAWLASHGYTPASFQASLVEQRIAAEMVARLVQAVPQSVEQVHARHILVGSRDEALVLQDELANGADFAALAVENSLDLSSRIAGGDLGWFPRGYLTTPEVESAAFSIQVGELSPVVESTLGFHLIEVLERDVRPLSPDALRALQEEAVRQWLQQQRQQAQIEILIGP